MREALSQRSFVVHGDRACPLLTTPSGRPYAAFARDEAGRLAVFGHDQVVASLSAQRDWEPLLLNTLAWLGAKTRSELPTEYTWDLSVVYANVDAWDQDVARIEGLLPELTALQGALAQGAAKLLRALNLRDEIAQILYQLYTYASNLKNSDSTEPTGQAHQFVGGDAQLLTDTLKFWEGRLETIKLEDRNLPAIIRKRVVRPRDEAARRIAVE